MILYVTKIVFSIALIACTCTLVNATNIALIQQYHQCKLLKMIAQKSSFGDGSSMVYVPDANIKNNTLDDAFFERQGYGNMTLDQALEALRKIYNEIANCNTSTCVCIRSYVLHDFDDYSAMFRNASFLAQAKLIGSAFIEKYKAFVLPEIEIQKVAESFKLRFPLTLLKFMVRHDFSLQRLYIYNREVQSKDFALFLGYAMPDFSLQESCEMSSVLLNRTLIVNPTSAQFETIFRCYLINYVNATVELQRFYALDLMVTVFPQMIPTLNLGNLMLAGFFDKLYKRAREFRPTVVYSSITLKTVNDYMVLDTFHNSTEIINDSSLSSRYLIFNSSVFRVDCERVISAGMSSRFRWLNLTVFLASDSKTKPASTWTLNILDNQLPSNAKNGTIFRDDRKLNVLQVFVTVENRVVVYHFDSSSRIILTDQFVQIASQVQFFQQTSSNKLVTKI